MTREDYKRAGDLFDQIRDLPVSDRSAALEAASAAKPELREQVVRLLEADRRAADAPFLNRPVMEDAAQSISDEPSGLPLPGTVIGSYRLGARIGAGGMGVVYQAEDLRLHRRVAVKILPLQSGAQAEEGIQRFQREARAAGQLNHPHIAAIYDAGFDDGCYYIAMELVEGRTLRALIAADSRFIEAKFVLDVISQIASALSAAHQAGIVHRDIKPENIMVRPDNFVKVLDFGLARMHEPSGLNGETDLRTRPGHLAGTVQYLSPEQVLGKPAGPLSDLFSLGVVAYEFATGVRPFDGPTDGAVYEAILHRDPALPSVVRPALGNELDGMILQALEKDPDLRFQTAGDMRSTCRRLSRSSNPNVTPNALAAPVISGRRKSWLTIGPFAVLGAVTLAGLLWYFAPVRRSGTIALPNHFQQLTDDPGEENFPSFSPDGKQFAYASARNNKWDIYLQRIGGSKFVDLTSDASGGNTQPAFSPDGSHIAFRSERDGGGIFVMEATGENPRRVAPLGYLPAWAPDNRRVAYCTHTFTTPKQVTQPPSDLYVVDLDKGSQRKLPSGDAQQPNWSPHGSRIAYWSVSAGGQRDIFTIDASGNGAPVPVTSDAAVDWNPVWSPSGGHLWFISDRGGTMNIWRVPIDERTGRTLGPPEPSTVPARFVGNLALAQDGKSIIFSEASQRYNLSRVGFDPERRVTTRTEALAAGHVVANFSFSPDGSRMVYDTLGDVSENLWIMNADGSGQRRLTSDVYRNRSPEWSPSGDEILFYSDRGGRYEDWLIGPDGSGLRAITSGSNPEMQGGLWSPDGKEILACRFGKTGMLNPRSAKPAVGPTPAPGLNNVSDLYCEEWTSGPDGDQALCHIITGKGENLIYSASKGKLEPTGTLGGHGASWVPPASLDDVPHRAFVFGRGSDCFLYDRVLRRQTLLFSVAPNQLHSVVVGRDGRHIYFSERVRDSDLWLGRLGE